MAGAVCDVCFKSDLPTSVYASSFGPVSFAYCEACTIAGAEPLAVIETAKPFVAVYYDSLNDDYHMWPSKSKCRIATKGSETEEPRVFLTRAEIVKEISGKFHKPISHTHTPWRPEYDISQSSNGGPHDTRRTFRMGKRTSN